MIILLLLSLVLLCAGIMENRIHQRNLQSIPVRIHVNGIRGKSTTTRLIAGGLREAGWSVLAKTTGTAARMILEDGTEVPVSRRGRPRIIEQRKIAATAARRGVQVLVVECMAVHPEMQWVAERQLIRSHIGVLTNVREDHLDQMGPTLEHVARTLALTIPENGHLVTSEKAFLHFLQAESEGRNTIVHPVRSFFVSNHELADFSYPTFKENVACALKVCELLGVSRETALRGMQKAAPDPGVMRVYRLPYQERTFYLVNAMAANDYRSTLQAWEVCRTQPLFHERPGLSVIGIVNNRADRVMRIGELASLAGVVPFERVILIGQMGIYARRCFQRRGLDRSRILDHSGRLQIDRLLEEACEESPGDLLFFAFGNMKGPGEVLVEYFIQNGEELQ